MLGNTIEIITKRSLFSIVPIPTLKTGIITPEMITVLEKIPKMYPIIVRKRQFKPKGVPVIKSRKSPEPNPVISPKSFPFSKEK